MISERKIWNRCRFAPEGTGGHYESFFQRANHPDRPLAFWIRYTIFSPKGRPQDTVGELWAIYFDGETGQITTAKQVIPISQCWFSDTDLNVRIGQVTLMDDRLEGLAESGGHTVQWALRYEGNEPPLLFLPFSFYERSFPKAKALVGTPNALYNGLLTIDGKQIEVNGWRGSQNHNWGSRHTDHYAWGQVAGFDNAPDAFLECSTAQVRLGGPFWTPRLTLMVLRVDGQEFALNSLTQAVRAYGRFDFFTWQIRSRTPQIRISVHIHAPMASFVGLTYNNPPGGTKTCLNTKLATCELTLDYPGHSPRILTTKHRAAFEILTDRQDHGVPVTA